MTEHEFTLLLHILGAAVLVGVVFFSLTLSIEKPLTVERVRIIKYVRPFGLYAAFWMLITGIHLAQHDWEDLSHNPVFWTKMALLAADGFIAEKIISKKLALMEAKASGGTVPETNLSVWTWTSAIIILAVFSLGFWLDIHHVH
jgi:uncharacterized membrane protein